MTQKNMSSYTLQLYIYLKKKNNFQQCTYSNFILNYPQMHIHGQKKSEGSDIVQNVSE